MTTAFRAYVERCLAPAPGDVVALGNLAARSVEHREALKTTVSINPCARPGARPG
jgi:hypothetical protein